MLVRRALTTTFFRNFSNKISPQEAINKTEKTIDVLNKRLQDWTCMDSVAFQRDGVGVPDTTTKFLSEKELVTVSAVAKSLGISFKGKGLVELRKEFLEKLTELNTFEIKGFKFNPTKK